jgi:Chaperone of endosialidase
MADTTSMFQSNPWTAGLLTAAGGIAGAFPQNTTTSGSSSGNTNLTSNASALSSILNNVNLQQGQTTSTQLDPATQAFLTQLMSGYTGLANTGTDMSGYTGSGLSSINQTFNGAQTNADQSLAARGLSTSPVAAAATANIQAARAGQQSQFLNSIPLIQNQLRQANLGSAANFFSMVPKTVSTMGTQTGTTSQIGNQSQAGNSVQNQSSNQNYKQSSGGGVGGFLSGLASVGGALALASDKRIKENIENESMSPEMAYKAVKALKPKTFNYKGEAVGNGHHGFIAQDVEKVMPHAVRDIGGIKHIDYAAIIPTIVKAVQHVGTMKEEKIAKSTERKAA